MLPLGWQFAPDPIYWRRQTSYSVYTSTHDTPSLEIYLVRINLCTCWSWLMYISTHGILSALATGTVAFVVGMGIRPLLWI